MNATHHHYMSLALDLAARGRFTVSPNPMVGCVIVKNNEVVGQGYHQYAGEPHAEIFALREAKEQSKGATAYVTLEPCCHHGKTPPCTSALIAAGIHKVYVACLDPNPLVAGKGMEALRAAGIQVEIGCLEAEAKALNEIFFHYIVNKRPFVIAKWAMSLDGKIKVNPSDTKQISGSESQRHTHEMRQQIDAILVGAHTVLEDNPQLTARLDDHSVGKQPLRVILSGQQKLPTDLKIFNLNLPGKTIIAATKNNEHLFKKMPHEKVELLILPENTDKQISLSALLDELGKRNIISLLVEGGTKVHESFLKEKLVNKIHVYLSPVIIGSSDKKQPIHIQNFSKQGEDFHLTANFREPSNV